MTDNEIIELFFLREESAIIETGNKYGRLCRKVSYNILANEEDMEECINSAYQKLWENIPPNKRNADIMFYKHYKMQERCRFTCYGERINWQYLCSRIEREEQVRIYID